METAEKTKVSAEGIPEAMLRNLYARAKESKRPGGFIKDEVAENMIAQLDYDFSAMEKDAVLGRGAIARMILLDQMVRDYIRRNPTAIIINLACGADSRFFRVDNGQIRWYGLDLEETVEICRRIMPASERLSYIGRPAMDEGWAAEVKVPEGSKADGAVSGGDVSGKRAGKGNGTPVLVIAESLSMHLTKQEVQKIFKIIRNRFVDVDVCMEIVMPYVVEHATEGRGASSRPRYTFGVKSGRKLAEMLYDFKCVKEVSLLAGLRKMYPSYYVMQFMPTMRRMSNKIVVLRKV